MQAYALPAYEGGFGGRCSIVRRGYRDRRKAPRLGMRLFGIHIVDLARAFAPYTVDCCGKQLDRSAFSVSQGIC